MLTFQRALHQHPLPLVSFSADDKRGKGNMFAYISRGKPPTTEHICYVYQCTASQVCHAHHHFSLVTSCTPSLLTRHLLHTVTSHSSHAAHCHFSLITCCTVTFQLITLSLATCTILDISNTSHITPCTYLHVAHVSIDHISTSCTSILFISFF